VNVAVGELVLSLKVTVLLPEVEAGTVNVAVKPPVVFVVEVLNVTDPPLKVAVTEWESSIPVAAIVTVEPTAPVFGLKVIEAGRALACILASAQIDNKIRNAIIKICSFFMFLSF
jgi:hypothetical protein